MELGHRSQLPASALDRGLPSTLDEDTGYLSGTESGTIAWFTLVVFVGAGTLALTARKVVKNDLAFALLPLLWPVGPSLAYAERGGMEHHRTAALALLVATGCLVLLAVARPLWSGWAKGAIVCMAVGLGVASFAHDPVLLGLGGLLVSASLLSSSLFVTERTRASRLRTGGASLWLLAAALLTALLAVEPFDPLTGLVWIPTLSALAPLAVRVGLAPRSLGFAVLAMAALYAATMPPALSGNDMLQNAVNRETASGDYVRARMGITDSIP